MSLAWPWALLGLLALPLVVVAYRRLCGSRPSGEPTSRGRASSSPHLVGTGGGMSRPSSSSRPWR